MKPYFDNGVVRLYQGNARDMAFLDDESVDCVITSPPYWGLRDYGLEPVVWDDGRTACLHTWGEETLVKRGHPGDKSTLVGTQTAAIPKAAGGQGSFCTLCPAWRGTLGLEPTSRLYVQHLVQIFREVWRVLKPTGTCWLNLGDSYAGSGGAHTLDHANPGISNSAHRNGYAGYVANEGRGRHKNNTGLKPKDLVGIPWRVAFALQEDGWWLRSDIIWAKPNPMPESVTDRPTRSHEYLFLLTKAERYYYDQEAVRETATTDHLPGRGYTMTDTRQTHGPQSGGNRGIANLLDKYNRDGLPTSRNRRSVWWIATQPYPEAHFATFPEKLVEPCILAGTSEKGNCPECGRPWARGVERTGHVNQREPAHVPNNTPSKVDSTGWAPTTIATDQWRLTCAHDVEPIPAVALDPFAGSGTVGVVAQRFGRHAVLVEQSEAYCDLVAKRIMTEPLPLIPVPEGGA